jgi:hypothetical protein
MAMNNNTEGRRVQADNGRMFESFMGGGDFEMQHGLAQMALAKKVRGTNQARCFSLVMINSGSAGLPFTAWRERTSWLFAAAHDEALGTAGGWAASTVPQLPVHRKSDSSQRFPELLLSGKPAGPSTTPGN